MLRCDEFTWLSLRGGYNLLRKLNSEDNLRICPLGLKRRILVFEWLDLGKLKEEKTRDLEGYVFPSFGIFLLILKSKGSAFKSNQTLNWVLLLQKWWKCFSKVIKLWNEFLTKRYSLHLFSLLWDFKLVEGEGIFIWPFSFLSFNIIYIYIFRLGRWINYDESHNY